MSALRLTGLTKTYAGHDRPALANLNLDVRPGEFLVLVGPSGCGKSTALRSVAGLEDPDSGTIHIGERDVTSVPPRDRDIAMVFQNYALYPHMSVFDNLAFGLKLRKTPKAEIDQRVREAAETLGLTRYLGSKPKALSGGERQRVALGRALVRRPAVFLFDEPLSNLDAQLRVQMRAELHRLHQQLTATMVYVTHDQVEAMTLGDRIAVLSAGVLQQVDAPLTVYERPANRFVAGFLGSPSMNFLAATVGEGGRSVRIAGANWTLEPALAAALSGRAGEAVTVGVRPEHIAVHGGAHGDPGALSGRVEFGEALGAETLLYVGTDAGRLVVRASGDARRSPGEAVRLVPEPLALRVFDALGASVGAAGAALTPA
ncbi:MAG: ABC transporter ATP-binding protein [Candidatus Eisenbacteria bacterium]